MGLKQQKTQSLVAQKALPFVVFLPLAWLLGAEVIVALYIVLGQAHFALTYVYQWRAGKMRGGMLLPVSYALLLVGLFWLVFHARLFMVLLISAFFVVHYYLDEFRLNEEQPTLGKFLLVVPLIALISVAMDAHEMAATQFYTAHFATLLPGAWTAGGDHAPEAVAYLNSLTGHTLDASWPWLWGLFAVGLFAALWQAIRHKKVEVTTAHMLLLTALAFTWVWLGSLSAVISIYGFIVLAHVAHWYTGMAMRLRQHAPTKLPRYYRDVAIANALIIAGYAYVKWAPAAPLAQELNLYYYSFQGFVVWSAMHLMTTLRVDDYKALFGRIGARAALAVQVVTRFRS